jgi:alpha-methylacyl-CoA racemase
MLLADMGADVIRVARAGPPDGFELLNRGRPAWAANLKDPADLARARTLAERADVLVEGYRPGVTERLGLGPDELLARNPRLVYARMTGWGQTGPLAETVGHDLNYLALTGALHAIGDADRPPPPPLNLVADFGGGSLYCVVGILAALWERNTSGKGQVIDAAIVDGVSSLLAMAYSLRASGLWSDERGGNIIDGSRPFYATYECSDGKFMAVGAMDKPYFLALQETLGVQLGRQNDPATWPAMRETLATVFAAHPQAHWEAVFADVAACVTPVRSMADAESDPHLAARGSVVRLDGNLEPNTAPRFSRTRTSPGEPGRPAGDLDPAVLDSWGIDPGDW